MDGRGGHYEGRLGVQRQQIECSLERTLAGGGGSVREVIISTEQPVRSGGGIARAAGCVTAPYMRNPVVMWGHNYKEPPIGRATALEISPGVGIVARFEFPPAGIYPLADVVRGLWDAGFVNAASIGFSPLEYELVDDPEAAEGGRRKDEGGRRDQIPVFTRWELYEFSLVAVPRDREAVRRALDALSSAPELGGRDALSVGAFDALDASSSALQRGGREARHLEALTEEAAELPAPGLDLQRFHDGPSAVRRVLHG